MNLRVQIRHRDQIVLFLGDGSEDGKVHPGSFCMISHKDREVIYAFDRADSQVTDEEVRQELAAMSRTGIWRLGIDMTQAVLLPQVTWRRQEKTEMVGSWKTKVYDMHNVVGSLKSRRIKDSRTSSSTSSEIGNRRKDSGEEHEHECEERFRPVLWLSPKFPLTTKELLPLLDILAYKVKAIRQLREVTTMLPDGTFPVKVSFQVVPTIRVSASFVKIKELPSVDEFVAPPTIPGAVTHPTGSSCFRWIKTTCQRSSSSDHSYNEVESLQDPFAIPQDYAWITAEAKKDKSRNHLK